MDILSRIAEEKIREAIEKGELNDLPGKGKPLQLEDLSNIPPELRISYKIMKNSGMLPEELQLKKEIVTLQNLLDCCYAEDERKTLKKKLNEKILRFNMLMEKRNLKKRTLGGYKNKIFAKLGRN